jgi:regulatory protein
MSNFGQPKKRREYKRPVPRDPDIPLTPEETEKLTRTSFNSCYWYLERGDKTRKELELKLKAKFIPNEIIEKVLDDLEEANYVNDVRFTENYIRIQQEYQKKGKKAIEFELRRKGVDSQIISEAISKVDDEKETENAIKLVQSKMRGTRNLDSQKRTNRLVSMLARKGYSSGAAYQIVKDAIREDNQRIEDEEQPDFQE